MKRRGFFGVLAGLFAAPFAAPFAGVPDRVTELPAADTHWFGMTDPSKTSADDIIRVLNNRRRAMGENHARRMEADFWSDTPSGEPIGISYWLKNG